MDEERFVSARDNPKNLGFVGFNNSKSMPPNDIAVQKPLPSILDRFKAMLKAREFRVLDEDDDDSRPSTEEIVRLYERVLSELTLNSKPMITDLTIIAGEHREHGAGIADAICARIVEAPIEQKLPSLYLLDSIVKNIGREYVRHFSSRLPEVFCEAYRQVHPNLCPAMRHLFGTWSTVFPPSVLRKIEAQLQFTPSVNHQPSAITSLRASESPRPTHGIHVNPKYLEARHQFEHSTADSVGSQRLGLTGRTPFALGTEKLLPSSDARVARSLSTPFDEFGVDNSPRRVIEGDSPSRPGFNYGLGRAGSREKETSEWRSNLWPDDTHERYETSAAYVRSNQFELQRPRALIDAYGNDQQKRVSNDINGVDSKSTSKTWQNTEEEEFDWEDMSPTLVDRSRSNDLASSSSIPPHGNFRTGPGFRTRNTAPSDTDFGRSNWSSQTLSVVNDSSVNHEDTVPRVGPGRGLISKITGLQNDSAPNLGSRDPQQAWNLPRHLRESSQQLNVKGSGSNIQMPFSANGIPSSDGEQKQLTNRFTEADSQFRGSLPALPRMVPSSMDYLNPETRPPMNVQNSHPFSSLSTIPPPIQISSQFDFINSNNTIRNQGLNKSFLPDQRLETIENNVPSSTTVSRFSNEQVRPIYLNLQYPAHVTHLQPQLPISLDPRQNPSHSVGLPLNHGYIPSGHAAAMSSVLPNPTPSMHLSMPIHYIQNRPMHLQGGALPPLPLGPRPVLSQVVPISQNPGVVAANPPAGSAFSGLISSLMSQGLISLTKQAPVLDSVGLEFDPDLLKVRHESAIAALYADLPRQCTTCGLRFKSQDEHSSHMDWHVTKNRISRNRKQKPSRKWFVSVSMWLSGAEALGTESVPGFLPTEIVVEQKADEELAVPADEDQNACALCGEPFEDFYSDETEEWMYKGAVYMNGSSGLTVGMDKSQLGPIVHAKCRSESSSVGEQDEGGLSEEGSQRKRMRS